MKKMRDLLMLKVVHTILLLLLLWLLVRFSSALASLRITVIYFLSFSICSFSVSLYIILPSRHGPSRSTPVFRFSVVHAYLPLLVKWLTVHIYASSFNHAISTVYDNQFRPIRRDDHVQRIWKD
jgi:hypothetical protein